MLAAIGAESIDELFADVPEGVRLGRPLDLPAGKPEQEVYGYLRDLAALNVSAEDEVSFLGAGMYDHYVPALIDSILSRSEFLTPYTPYQPEISQGGAAGDVRVPDRDLRADRSAGLERERSTRARARVAAAGYLAKLHQPGRTRFLVCRGVHPHSRETLATTSAAGGRRSRRSRSPAARPTPRRSPPRSATTSPRCSCSTRTSSARSRTSRRSSPAAKAAGALVIVQCDPLPLGILRPPGEFGVDVAVGEGQTLGNRLDYGGPSFGFFAAREELHPPHAGPDRGRDHRRRRPPRLRAHAADARAAHPAREGDAQHLHRAGAQRARGR